MDEPLSYRVVDFGFNLLGYTVVLVIIIIFGIVPGALIIVFFVTNIFIFILPTPEIF
nr:hypothetical protein [uncultured Desulfobacter sp.]